MAISLLTSTPAPAVPSGSRLVRGALLPFPSLDKSKMEDRKSGGMWWAKA